MAQTGMPAWRIEAIESSDHAAAAALIVRIQQEFGIAIGLADQPDLLDIQKFYVEGGGNFWAAFLGATVIGTAALIDRGNGIGVVRKMFVDPAFRGVARGVGQALLETLQRYAENRGITALYLGTTDKFLAAQRFYLKNGFTAIAEQELPPEVAAIRMRVDTVHYHKRLS